MCIVMKLMRLSRCHCPNQQQKVLQELCIKMFLCARLYTCHVHSRAALQPPCTHGRMPAHKSAEHPTGGWVLQADQIGRS